MDFQGKRVLVTGGSRRGGAALVTAFARRGATLIIHANGHIDEAETLRRNLPGAGHRVIAADFTRPGAADDLFARAGKIDILVNNASFFRLHPDNTEEENRLFRQINREVPEKLMELFVRQEIASGCVINILDAAIWRDDDSPYVRSRRELGNLTLAYAKQYGEKNLRFNAVAPGPMLPPLELPDSKMEKILQSVPLHRKVEVDDFVNAVLFLAQCDSITGAILPVDGGMHL